MRKRRKSAVKLLLATIVLTAGMSLSAYAEENAEIKAAVQRATDAGAGSYQDSYISGGWKTVNNIEFLRAFKDEGGMIISPTSGIISKAQGKYAYLASNYKPFRASPLSAYTRPLSFRIGCSYIYLRL